VFEVMRLFERVWNLLRLIYLYLTRRRYAQHEGQFYEIRGDCYWGIGWKVGAALDYHGALKKSEDPAIVGLHAKLGFVYTELNMADRALQHCRIAYDKDESPAIGIALAYALYNTRNMNEFMSLCLQLQLAASDVPPELQSSLTGLVMLYIKEIDRLGQVSTDTHADCADR
jgi:hypothetical protein